MNKKIAIIGGGNLGTAIAEGLLKSKFSKPEILSLQRNVLHIERIQSKKELPVSRQ